jgi:hypothetical protein
MTRTNDDLVVDKPTKMHIKSMTMTSNKTGDILARCLVVGVPTRLFFMRLHFMHRFNLCWYLGSVSAVVHDFVIFKDRIWVCVPMKFMDVITGFTCIFRAFVVSTVAFGVVTPFNVLQNGEKWLDGVSLTRSWIASPSRYLR